MDHADRHLESLVNLPCEKVACRREGSDGRRGANLPCAVAAGLRSQRHRLLDIEHPDLRIVGRGDLLLLVGEGWRIALLNGHLHVRLSAAKPDLSHEHIGKRYLTVARYGYGEGTTSGGRSEPCHPPARTVYHRLSTSAPTRLNLDFCVGSARTPDCRIGMLLQHHVVLEGRPELQSRRDDDNGE
ncbi:MAG: hypothetical protein HONBIEJF_02308 [Fimbriimonadaceae bacterium]|nr:hypothetical protein [Fimbriimonadaceae bacterium]